MSTDQLLDFVRRLPAALRETFTRGDRATFDRVLETSEMFSPGISASIDELADRHAIDPTPGSAYDTLDAIARRRLIDDADR